MADGAIFTRRRFLRVVLGAGGLVLAGGAGLLALRGRAARVTGLRCLSAHEFRTLSRLAEALFPAAGAFAAGATGADLARRFDGWLADEPPWNRADLKGALLLLELGPVLFAGRLATFSHLGVAERLAHFQQWQDSSSALRRQAAAALGKFLSLVYYDQPELWPAIGYDGPLVTP